MNDSMREAILRWSGLSVRIWRDTEVYLHEDGTRYIIIPPNNSPVSVPVATIDAWVH